MRRGFKHGRERQKLALSERCTTKAKPHLQSFNLKVGNLEHQDAQVLSRAHPLRPTRTELDEVLQKAKPGKATSNIIAMELLQACSASPEAFGLLHGLVSDVFEDERAAPPAPPVMPPDGPASDLATMRHGERLLYLVGGAKDHGWRCQWQVENPKGGLSKDRYALYCGAATYAEPSGWG